MPKLLFVANSFALVGGVETSALPWLDELARRGCQLECVLARVLGGRTDLLTGRGIPVTFLRLYWHWRGLQIPNPAGILALARRIRQGGYDAVIGLQPPSHYFLRIAVLLSGRRPHTVVLEQLSYQDRTWIYVQMDRWLSPVTSAYLCVSESLKHEFLRRSRFPAAKAFGIPHGIRVPAQTAPAADLQARARGRLVVGCVARLTGVKRQRLLIEAFEHICRRMETRPLLVLAGDDSEDLGLAQEVQARGLQEDVWVLGHREDVHAVYALLDVFVLPSVLEGFGLVWAEAMAHGIPVITTRIPPMTEFLRHEENGLLFEADDRAGLEACLARLIESPDLRRRLGEAGRQYVATHLDHDRQCGKYVDAFLGEAATVRD